MPPHREHPPGVAGLGASNRRPEGVWYMSDTYQSLIEEVRVRHQSRLDSSRTAEHRNKLGQHATPTGLAEDILRCSETLLLPDEPVRFMDPAFGTGAFYSALERTIPGHRIAGAVGYEINASLGEIAGELWSETRLELHVKDFTLVDLPDDANRKSNLIVCNPPYVRHHHIERKKKGVFAEASEGQDRNLRQRPCRASLLFLVPCP